jgi:hypothetical protein
MAREGQLVRHSNQVNTWKIAPDANRKKEPD